MNFTPTSDLETKSFSELSIFDGIGANFKKHLDTHLAQANLEENKPDSLFVESVVIHNDINLEEELSKIRDDDEGAFKILSMSFYDNKTRAAPTKPPGQSPTRLDENNKLLALRAKAKTPINLEFPGKTGSQPSLTPLVNEVNNIHQIRDRKLGSPKVAMRPDLKLFAIKERVKLDTSSQLSPQKPNFHLSLMVSPNDKSNTQTSIKDRLKHEKEIVRPQKPLSPRKDSREPSMEKKYTILDMKISDLVKSKSPTFAVKKSSSKERIFASPPRITFNVSPKGFRFHPKMNTSNEKLAISRETSENKMSLSRKNETEHSPLRSPSPVFALNKNVLARRFDLQRVSLNNINYSSSKDLPVKESKTPSKIVQKVSEVVMQQQHQQQAELQAQLQAHQIQPVKTENAKGYRSNQSFYTKNGSRRGSNLEQKNSKLLLNQKLRINTEENSALKISMRDISDSSIYMTGSRSVKGKMKMLDFSSIKQRDISGFSSSKDMFDPVKLNFKSQSKTKIKETKDRHKEVNTSKPAHPVLPLQSRAFDI